MGLLLSLFAYVPGLVFSFLLIHVGAKFAFPSTLSKWAFIGSATLIYVVVQRGSNIIIGPLESPENIALTSVACALALVWCIAAWDGEFVRGQAVEVRDGKTSDVEKDQVVEFGDEKVSDVQSEPYTNEKI